MKTFTIAPIQFRHTPKTKCFNEMVAGEKKKIHHNLNCNKMEITGRLTRNAQVKTTTSGKEFISFSIAQNDSYKAKGSKKVTRIVTYIECTYWRGTNIAPFMTKGTIVELTGRIMANAWKNKEGEPKGQLACNVSTIKLLGGGSRTTEGEKQGSSKAKTEKAEESQPVAAGDDLPF